MQALSTFSGILYENLSMIDSQNNWEVDCPHPKWLASVHTDRINWGKRGTSASSHFLSAHTEGMSVEKQV